MYHNAPCTGQCKPAPAPAPAPALCQKPGSNPVPTVAVSPPCFTPVKAFSPGTLYVLLNARGGTAMDMSGADNKTIIGYPMHGGPNQQWDFIPFGLGYAIRCMRPATDGNVLYLTVDADCGGVRDCTPVVAGTHPVAWNVQQTDEGIIISWPNSNYVFDLSNWGDKTPGTKIQLMPLLPGELCQLWRLDARGPAPDVCDIAVSSTCSMETFTTGMYHVVLNAHGGTVVDMSGAVNTTIVGNAMHGGDTQQWEIVKFGLGYSIRCARASAEGHALYLTVDGSGPRDCAPVVAGTHPVAWNVERVEAGIRISWADSKYVLHLVNDGDEAACKKIQLMPLVPGELCQLWRATQVTAVCK